ncbi:STAS domain-containing protein [Streptomyces sp. NPDC008141]|uniref:STAS domain-containing protein n=1 Tax=Streptomyces sp. NPDC008141 TaxID=3364815 RepID=UPI0036E479A7
MRDFNVNVSNFADRTIVTVSGELDFDTCPQVTEVTDSLTLRKSTLVLDLSDVSFMDSVSLTMLLRLRERTQSDNCALELHSLQDPVRRVLDVTGAANLFVIHPDQAAA